MKKKYSSVISVATAIAISACGGGGSSSSPDINNTNETASSVPTVKTISLSGTAIDGYISGATACLDTNSDGVCSSTEPKTITLADGTFSFDGVEVPADSLFPVIVSGGTDTATGNAFLGELKNIIDSTTITAGTPLNVTPLTDLVATSFFQSPVKDMQALSDSKKEIAQTFNILEEDVIADPMKNATLFAKTQEVQQIKTLLETTATKAKGADFSGADKLVLQNEIKDALVKQLKSETTLDVDKILGEVERVSHVSIPKNEKTFITEQVADTKNVLNTLANDTTVALSNLDKFQAGLEAQQAQITEKIKQSTHEKILEIIQISNPQMLIQNGQDMQSSSSVPSQSPSSSAPQSTNNTSNPPNLINQVTQQPQEQPVEDMTHIIIVPTTDTNTLSPQPSMPNSPMSSVASQSSSSSATQPINGTPPSTPTLPTSSVASQSSSSSATTNPNEPVVLIAPPSTPTF